MTKRVQAAAVLAAGFVLAGAAAPCLAQDGGRPVPTTGTVDIERLPIDLERIQRKLNRSKDVETRDGLNLRYLIHIYGQAPPIEWFAEGENLATGPVPWGAPTHQEIINQITPQQYRAPFMDFGALMRWLRDRDKEKKK